MTKTPKNTKKWQKKAIFPPFLKRGPHLRRGGKNIKKGHFFKKNIKKRGNFRKHPFFRGVFNSLSKIEKTPFFLGSLDPFFSLFLKYLAIKGGFSPFLILANKEKMPKIWHFSHISGFKFRFNKGEMPEISGFPWVFYLKNP